MKVNGHGPGLEAPSGGFARPINFWRRSSHTFDPRSQQLLGPNPCNFWPRFQPKMDGVAEQKWLTGGTELARGPEHFWSKCHVSLALAVPGATGRGPIKMNTIREKCSKPPFDPPSKSIL